VCGYHEPLLFSALQHLLHGPWTMDHEPREEKRWGEQAEEKKVAAHWTWVSLRPNRGDRLAGGLWGGILMFWKGPDWQLACSRRTGKLGKTWHTTLDDRGVWSCSNDCQAAGLLPSRRHDPSPQWAWCLDPIEAFDRSADHALASGARITSPTADAFLRDSSGVETGWP